ncbi:FAD-dependent oxidoreductase [Pseudonocardia sp. NPDC049635]|uniref:FAD-dependent oxidoreductase n=1 Tax=Pseudonocardia sp. NPDC049635 TaxID=3155506 RepID=UPI0033CA80F1
MAFCDPRAYDGFGPQVRRDRVIEQPVELYGAEAAAPIDFADHRWGTEPFAPGGRNPAVPPYVMTTHGSALTEPHGRTHWGGSETAGDAAAAGDAGAEALAVIQMISASAPMTPDAAQCTRFTPDVPDASTDAAGALIDPSLRGHRPPPGR